jgi:hypothetical protein
MKHFLSADSLEDLEMIQNSSYDGEEDFLQNEDSYGSENNKKSRYPIESAKSPKSNASKTSTPSSLSSSSNNISINERLTPNHHLIYSHGCNINGFVLVLGF